METLKATEYIPVKSSTGVEYYKVSPGVWGMKILFVNIFIIATDEDQNSSWVLIDSGLKGFGDKIIKMAEDIFGEGTRPSSIVLTHGHFDHVGSLEELLEIWKVPVYAHYLELPYLKGISSYPPPDPMVGGGLMSLLSFTYPKRPKDLGNKVRRIAPNGVVPYLSDWQLIHTPGHSPGQVALFRETDGTLISADAFVTTKQESVFSVIIQRHILSGPPKYFTMDWIAAKESVQRLLDLKPQVAATGHGYPMYGEELIASLTRLVENFEKIAVPRYGRYVRESARANKNGVQYIPRKVNNPELIATVAIVAVTAMTILYKISAGKSKRRQSFLSSIGDTISSRLRPVLKL